MTPESLFGILYAVVAARHLAQRSDDGGAAITIDNVSRARDPPERHAALVPVEETPECPAALGRDLACIPTDHETRRTIAFLDAGASSNATDQCPEARGMPVPDADAPSPSAPSGCTTLRRQLCGASKSSTVFVTDASVDDGDAMPTGGGALVELYAPDSHYATPAILTGPSEKSQDVKYHLKSVSTNGRPARVDPEFIHAYRAYEEGTRASCNAGGATRPCTIESHAVRGGGVIMYEVSLPGEEGERQTLLFSRVQRILGQTDELGTIA